MSDRRLTVLLHADVAGSTGLVHMHETTAHARMTQAFMRLSKIVEQFGGTVHEVRGDALVAELARASDAISAALAFQLENVRFNQQLTDDVIPTVRIGIALGEVVIADGTVTGPGIVLAQRVEQYAQPDGVSVTAAIREATPNRLPFAFTDLDEQHAKGFDEPVHMFAVQLVDGETVPVPDAATPHNAPNKRTRRLRLVAAVAIALVCVLAAALWSSQTTAPVSAASIADMKHPLPDKPSIVVLPLKDQSETTAQTSLADALTEDLISSLARIEGVFVISQGSSFAYKGKRTSVEQVAEDLGVRYVVEGSLRRSGAQVRVSIRLIDALTGHTLWADRLDREFDDLFELQDELTRTIATELAIPLIWNRGRSQTRSVEAHLLWRKAHRDTYAISAGALQQAQRLANRALQLDPDYVRAKALLAFTMTQMAFFRFIDEPQDRFREALELAYSAAREAPSDWYTQMTLAQCLMNIGDFRKAAEAYEYAASLDPANAQVLAFAALPRVFLGESDAAIAHLETSMRMNPFHSWHQPQFLGMALYLKGEYQRALPHLEQSAKRNPGFIGNWLWRAATYGQLGMQAEADKVSRQILAKMPGFTIATSFVKFGNEAPRQHFERGLRLAGLPE